MDRDVAAVILRTGTDTLPHGAIGTLRSLGRAGIACYVASIELSKVEACSRYLRGHVPLSVECSYQPEALARVLLGAADRLPARPVIVANDDEASVVLAEARETLASRFRLPPVPPDLPRRLASKPALYRLCGEHGTPTLPCWFPRDHGHLFEIAAEIGFPLVVKNAVPFLRLRAGWGPATAIVGDAGRLAHLARDRADMSEILVQAYLPEEHAEDWIVHGYCDTQGRVAVLFTGRKVLSWPLSGGSTARGRVQTNEDLAALAATFCRRIGYRGIFDMDWRLDRRDGRYNLLDFNPRTGAQHRLFEDWGGVDVVRALHLDLSGRPIPSSPPREGEELMVENLEAAARLALLRAPRGPARSRSISVLEGRTDPGPPARGRLAWFARDDPKPFFAMIGEQARRLWNRTLREQRRTGLSPDPPNRSEVWGVFDRPNPWVWRETS